MNTEVVKKALYLFCFILIVFVAILTVNTVKIEEKVMEVKRKIEEGDYEAAYANLGRAVSHATTACDRTMRTLIEKGLM